MTKTLLLLARDPGGANTLIPLIAPLQARGYTVLLYGKDTALKKYQESGLPGVDLCDELTVISPASLKTFVRDRKPDLVLTGTSAEDMVEKWVWKACADLGIPCAAILDQWLNYGVRFSEFGVSQIKDYEAHPTHAFVPAHILVMDEHAKEEMTRIGFHQDQLIVTGQPYFEHVQEQWRQITPERTRATKTQLGIDPNHRVLTFVSEPLSQMLPDSSTDEDHPYGYTETSILHHLTRAIEQLEPESLRGWTLLIKLHPRDSADTYHSLKARLDSLAIPIVMDQHLSPWNTLSISEVVCGMTSMLLIEAFLLRKPLLNIQIGLRGGNPFILAQREWISSVTDPEKLTDELTQILNNPQPDATQQMPLIANPVERVLQFVDRQLALSAKQPAGQP